jgi:hypothetical protein
MRRPLRSVLLFGLFYSALQASGQANPPIYGEIIPASSGLPQLAHAPAATCSQLTFACLYPAFLKDEIPAYWQYVSPTSPANYDKAANDYLSQFTSPSGIDVRVVVKSPVTTTEYDVPPISPTETVNQYFHNAFYDDGKLRTKTVIIFPKSTYNFAWGVYSNCNGSFNWNLPVGLTDVVIDGQGSKIVFSGLCNGVSVWNAQRVVLKNFHFSWSNLKMAAVGTVTAVDLAAGTYAVHIDPITFGPSPKFIASVFAWDPANDHVDLIHWRQDAFYGDGVTGGTAVECEEPKELQKTSGCTMTLNLEGSPYFSEGQSVVLHFYNYGSAIAVNGEDVTFDNLSLDNIIGTGFAMWGGRGIRVTHSTLTRMQGEPVGIAGNASGEFGSVSGDVVFDHNFFGYSGDDGYQLNWNIVQYSPKQPPVPIYPSQLMPVYVSASNQIAWPYLAQVGDTFVVYDYALNYQYVRKVNAVNCLSGSCPSTTDPYILTFDQPIDAGLVTKGFVGGDLTQFAGARYVVSNNDFQYTAGRALILQTPFGLVNNNHFVGQTTRQIYLMTSEYWGEGGSAEELTISNNTFDATGHGGTAPTSTGGDFLPIDIAAEPASPYRNFGPEVTGSENHVAASVNQNVIVAGNTFITDNITAVVNLSSANGIVFSGNSFFLNGSAAAAASDQYPISLHDISNVYFDSANSFSQSWLNGASCQESRLLQLTRPAPVVSVDGSLACAIADTTSNIIVAHPTVVP